MAHLLVKLAAVTVVLTAGTAHAVELRPTLTPANGLSCGRTTQPEGVECDAPQCYDTSVSREFRTWADFENGFLRDEVKRVGLLSMPTDFSDLCKGYPAFSPEERELFWLDFLKMMAAFESSYLWLSAYDDLVEGKIMTERGFFQVGRADCAGSPEVQRDYCAVHWPKVNARCALTIMASLVRSRRGKTIDAIAAHWGSMRSSGRNAEGGRREKLQKSFMQHPACQFAAATTARAPRPARNGRRRVASPPTASDPNVERPKYDRLKPAMYPDSDFPAGKILPSYRPRPNATCEGVAAGDEPRMKQCRRLLAWKHYEEVDREWADAHSSN